MTNACQQIELDAIRYLSRREYSFQELVTKLLNKKHDPAQINHVLNKLAQSNYLSDERYAESFIRSKSLKGYGPVKISYELKAKGVAQEIIDQTFDVLAICSTRGDVPSI